MAYNDREFYQMLKDAEKLMYDAYNKGYLDGKASVECKIRTENDAYKFGLLDGAVQYLKTKDRFVKYYLEYMRRPGDKGFPTYIERDWSMAEHAAKQMLEWGELNPPEQEDNDERKEEV